ncbi:MAG: hypothetical protein IJV76_13360 [Clostridia bacterium]|nr:hypothetical protein [Clostridia bacterium]
MFNIFKKRNVFSSIVQIIIVVILLPGLCIVFNSLLPEQSETLFSELITKFLSPLIKRLEDIFLPSELTEQTAEIVLHQYSLPASLNYIALIWQTISSNAVQVVFLGLCINIFNILYVKILHIPGLPILVTVCGILMGCFALNMTDSLLLTFQILIFLILLNIILEMIFVHKGNPAEIISVLLSLGCSGVFSGIVGCYTLTLVLVAQNRISSIVTAIELLFVTSFAMIIYLILEAFLKP